MTSFKACNGYLTPPKRGSRSGGKASPSVSYFVIAALVLVLTTACSTPVLEQSVDVPPKYAAVAASSDEPEAAWWESFGDPVLSELIKRAARENRDVKIAAERVRAARAAETISRSALFPSIGISATGSDYRTGFDAATRQSVPSAANIKSATAGVNVAWEPDITGRLSSGATAASADTLAAAYGARGVRLLVMTDVATSYFTLVGALRQLETVRAIAAAHDETLRLVTARERAGLATAFDVERAQTDASQAHAAIPPLETLAASSRHRIAVLTGDQAFHADAIKPWSGNVTAPVVQTGQPAALLERRPDLLAAKAQLDAANARRRQAKAEYFPRLLLGAAFGGTGTELNGMSIGSARFTNVIGLLAMPIFNAGRTEAINIQAESAQSEALLRYEHSIVRALEDVENALVSLQDERRRSQTLNNGAASAESALSRAQSLYDRGQIDLLPLLDAQRVRLNVSLSANDSNTQLLLDAVQLYKALGGGWQFFEPTTGSAARNPNS